VTNKCVFPLRKHTHTCAHAHPYPQKAFTNSLTYLHIHARLLGLVLVLMSNFILQTLSFGRLTKPSKCERFIHIVRLCVCVGDCVGVCVGVCVSVCLERGRLTHTINTIIVCLCLCLFLLRLFVCLCTMMTIDSLAALTDSLAALTGLLHPPKNETATQTCAFV